MKQLFALKLILPLLTSLVFLLLINQFLKEYQQKQHEQIARNLLHHSEGVTLQLAEALKEASRIGINNCSSENISKLKTIRQKYKNIDDIGFLKNNKIVCTAIWGGLPEEVEMPKSYYRTPSGYYLYSFVGQNPYIKSRPSTVQNDLIVFNSIPSFIDFLDILPEYNITVATHNQRLIFFSRGIKKPEHTDGFGDLFIVKTTTCSTIRDICVSTNRNDSGLMALPWLFIFILLAGLIPGILLDSLLSNYLSSKKSLEKRFVRAIKRNELYMVYQPIFKVSNKQVVGFEALLRWQDGYFGAVSPELFITLAERLGIYHKLSEFVVRKSLEEMKDRLTTNPQLQLSINIGDEEIHDTKFTLRLKEQCHSKGVAHEQIKLEISERCKSDDEVLSEFCRTVRQLGFKISLDDFGTGSCNIAWLTELDFDEIKIDKILVQNIVDPDKRKILLSIVDALRITGKSLVFEGVETCSQFDLIHILNPDYLVQGWHTGKPVLATQVKDIMNATS